MTPPPPPPRCPAPSTCRPAAARPLPTHAEAPAAATMPGVKSPALQENGGDKAGFGSTADLVSADAPPAPAAMPPAKPPLAAPAANGTQVRAGMGRPQCAMASLLARARMPRMAATPPPHAAPTRLPRPVPPRRPQASSGAQPANELQALKEVLAKAKAAQAAYARYSQEQAGAGFVWAGGCVGGWAGERRAARRRQPSCSPLRLSATRCSSPRAPSCALTCCPPISAPPSPHPPSLPPPAPPGGRHL